jgi:hypothetical protein
MSKQKVMDSKAMLEKANKEKRVIRYTDRVPLEILTETKHYKKGQRINPHPLVAEQLVANGVAKELKQ